MGLDLHFRGTNSELVPTGNNWQPYEPLKIEYDDFFTLNDHISKCSWSEGLIIRNSAPVKVDEDGIITDFRIQTTSYGALKVEDTKKFIEAYNEAVEVVEILKAKFVNKDK